MNNLNELLEQPYDLIFMGPKPGDDIFGEFDRTETNDDDGQKFYGYDDEETGTTTWYDEDGTLDCETPTPDDDD